MNLWNRRIALSASFLLLALASAPGQAAWGEKRLVGTYRLVERVAVAGGARKSPPEVLGTLTFTKTHRTVIMKWMSADGEPVSIAQISTYTLSGGRYCESVVYGAQSNLGAPGVTYDTPSESPVCTAAISDAAGFSFDVPGEKLRIQVSRDKLIGTTPRWTDHWEKVK